MISLVTVSAGLLLQYDSQIGLNFVSFWAAGWLFSRSLFPDLFGWARRLASITEPC